MCQNKRRLCTVETFNGNETYLCIEAKYVTLEKAGHWKEGAQLQVTKNWSIHCQTHEEERGSTQLLRLSVDKMQMSQVEASESLETSRNTVKIVSALDLLRQYSSSLEGVLILQAKGYWAMGTAVLLLPFCHIWHTRPGQITVGQWGEQSSRQRAGSEGRAQRLQRWVTTSTWAELTEKGLRLLAISMLVSWSKASVGWEGFIKE